MEQQYLDALREVINTGTRQANRTGIDAITVPGLMLKFDMADGFPLLTTKKMAFDACKGEFVAFMQGRTNAAEFREYGCNIWNANANENGVTASGDVVPNAWLSSPHRKGQDDLGRVYGAQWRDWQTYETMTVAHDDDGVPLKGFVDGKLLYTKGKSIDQVLTALDQIRNNPTSRRIIISGWRPDEFDQMALPPCHVMYQFLVNTERRELNLCMYQRSCDMFLGVPFNIASASLMLHLFARLTGLRPRHFTHFLADAHIYVNHLDQVNMQLARHPYAPPKLEINLFGLGMSDDNTVIKTMRPGSFYVTGYTHHGPIKASMNV